MSVVNLGEVIEALKKGFEETITYLENITRSNIISSTPLPVQGEISDDWDDYYSESNSTNTSTNSNPQPNNTNNEDEDDYWDDDVDWFDDEEEEEEDEDLRELREIQRGLL